MGDAKGERERKRKISNVKVSCLMTDFQDGEFEVFAGWEMQRKKDLKGGGGGEGGGGGKKKKKKFIFF